MLGRRPTFKIFHVLCQGGEKTSTAQILNATLETCKQLTAESSTEDPDPNCNVFPRTFIETVDNHFAVPYSY